MFAIVAGALLAAVSASFPRGDVSIVTRRPAASTWKRTQCGSPSGTAEIPSKWASEVSPASTPLVAYPRPQMVRGSGWLDGPSMRDIGDPSTWTNLNGLWEWQKTTSATPPFGQTLAGSILVPFPVESCLSGVAPQKSADIVKTMWYRLPFNHNSSTGGRTLLHFGGVDWQTTVYLNKQNIGGHTGGYDGFSFDITDQLQATDNELLVYVYDPSDSGAQPNGKQRVNAIDHPGGDTYTPSSGIWQTVWLESVPQSYIETLKIDQASLATVTVTAGLAVPGPRISFEVLDGGKTIATGSGNSGEAVTLNVPAPAKLWSPDSPHLYDLVVTSGEDKVLSYFGLRTFVLGKGQEVPEGPYMKGYDRGGGDMAPCGAPGCIMNKTAASSDCKTKCKDTKGCAAYVYADANCSGKSGPICWLKNSFISSVWVASHGTHISRL